LVLFLGRPSSVEFSSKGAPTKGVSLSASCADTCRPGQMLLFQIEDAPEPGLLAAWAQPAGSPSAERIWYFPTGDGTFL
jgi:hypothetical protein